MDESIIEMMFSKIIFISYNLGISIFFLSYLLGFPFFFFIDRTKALSRIGYLNRREIDSNNRPQSLVWIHAVSGGEVKLVEKIICNHFSGKRVFLTYMSHSARQMAGLIFKNRSDIVHSYLPFDFYPVMKHWIKKIHPERMVIIEHDLWANKLFLAKKHHINTSVLNFFMKSKDRFFYRLFPFLLKLTHRVDAIFTQNDQDVLWLKSHLKTTLVKKVGNIKLNQQIRKIPSQLEHYFSSLRQLKTPVVILGSSHQGEEVILLSALNQSIIEKKILLVIIPRHPQRVSQITEMIRQFDATFRSVLFSDSLKTKLDSPPPIIIVDRMGLSEYFYQIGAINIIGDSFIPTQGGHNFLESLQYGVCTLYGEYLSSFKEITHHLERERGVLRVNISDLEPTLSDLIISEPKRKKIGQRGRKLIEKLDYDQKTIHSYLQVTSPPNSLNSLL